MALPDLKDKIVFITGAASGIGAATARAFAAQGCRGRLQLTVPERHQLVNQTR